MFVQGLISSAAEVVAVCGFVFGVACKLPPSLTILLLSGVFWFVIGRHFFWDFFYKRIIRQTDYDDIEESIEGTYSLFLKHRLVPILECIAFLMQLSALIAVPILLAHTEDRYEGENDSYMTMYVLIPVTLTVISIVWSGWLQNYLVKPKVKRATVHDNVCVARLKSGK